MRKIFFTTFACLFGLGMFARGVKPVPFAYQTMHGELQQRLLKNLQRLHEEKYQPDHVFLTMAESGDWPGDTEGRTLLALVLDAQATHQQAQYLEEIVRRIPLHLNERGYMGPVFDTCHEQQLSGNGWLLRGLCAYYEWKHDRAVLEMIRTLAVNLFTPLKGYYAEYPISPEERVQNVGAESGSMVGRIGRWQLSSDIGCVFIGMEGLIHAYVVTKDARLKPVIEELIRRFLEIDLMAIKAQTHASLTACRGLLRYADATGKHALVKEAERRFMLYVENGMTENYENYNWFQRFDTWTEPCAIVDSYLLAVQLWQHTRNPRYLEYAEQIYYNALCRTQRFNGGFGTDVCPGAAIHSAYLDVSAPEAHWCCTMRGGEGLSCAASYSAWQEGKEVYFPFLRDAAFTFEMDGQRMQVTEETGYPFAGNMSMKLQMEKATKMAINLPVYLWMEHVTLALNGKPVPLQIFKGFARIKRTFEPGDCITMSFTMPQRAVPVVNRNNALSHDSKRWMKGPLLLGQEEGKDTLCPIYHLFDPRVWEPGAKREKILF